MNKEQIILLGKKNYYKVVIKHNQHKYVSCSTAWVIFSCIFPTNRSSSGHWNYKCNFIFEWVAGDLNLWMLQYTR